jgi:hypothetical protein
MVRGIEQDRKECRDHNGIDTRTRGIDVHDASVVRMQNHDTRAIERFNPFAELGARS